MHNCAYTLVVRNAINNYRYMKIFRNMNNVQHAFYL